MDSTEFKNLYHTFCSFGSGSLVTEMDGAKWVKFCKDLKIVGKTFTSTDCDLIFAKVKGKTERKITFDQFKEAFKLAAEKKKADPEELAKKCLEVGGPSSSGTKAETGGIFEKMTDTSQYTGAHQARFNADGTGKGLAGRDMQANTADLSQMTRPNLGPNGTTGATKPTAGTGDKPHAERAVTPLGELPKKRATPKPGEKSAPTSKPSSQNNSRAASPVSDMTEVFSKFCNFGGGKGVTELDNAKFAKFAKDSKLLDKKLTATDVDLIFTKVKGKTERKINYDQFQAGLGLMAEKKGITKDALVDKVLSAGGPKSSGTKAENDAILQKMTDTSQYTGAHAARFDADGKGKGAAGRDTGSKTADLSQMTRPNLG